MSQADKAPVAFLSEAWLEHFAAVLESAPAVDSTTRLALGQLVHEEGRDVAWTVLLGAGESAELREGLEEATVTLVCDLATARSIAAGASPAGFLSKGLVKVRGDANALIDAQGALLAIGEALGAVASRTSF